MGHGSSPPVVVAVDDVRWLWNGAPSRGWRLTGTVPEESLPPALSMTRVVNDWEGRNLARDETGLRT